MKKLRKNIIIRIFCLGLSVIFLSQQLSWAEVIDLRDEIGGSVWQDYLLGGIIGYASAQAIKPSWSVTQTFLYTYLIPEVANQVTKPLIKDPYLRAGVNAFISAGARGYLEYKDVAKALAKEGFSEVAKEASKEAIKGALVTAATASAEALVLEYAKKKKWGGFGYLAQVIIGTAVEAGLKGTLGIEFDLDPKLGAFVKSVKKVDFGKALVRALKDKAFLRRLEAEGIRVLIEELGRMAGVNEELLTVAGASLSRMIAGKLSKDDKKNLEDRLGFAQMELDELQWGLDNTTAQAERERLQRAIADQELEIKAIDSALNVSDKKLFWEGLQVGALSVALQYLSRQTRSPLHGAMFNAMASSVLQAALIRQDVLLALSGQDEKQREILTKASRGYWLFQGIIAHTFTQAAADVMSMGRAGYRVTAANEFEFVWHSGWDPWTLARYVGYMKDLRDEDFLTALMNQFISSYHYQAVRNISEILNGAINRRVYVQDKNLGLRHATRMLQAQQLLDRMVELRKKQLDDINREIAQLEGQQPVAAAGAEVGSPQQQGAPGGPAEYRLAEVSLADQPEVWENPSHPLNPLNPLNSAEAKEQRLAELKRQAADIQAEIMGFDLAAAQKKQYAKDTRTGIQAHVLGLIPHEIGLLLAHTAASSVDQDRHVKEMLRQVDDIIATADNLRAEDRALLVATREALGEYLEARQDGMRLKILREIGGDMYNLDAFGGEEAFKERFAGLVQVNPALPQQRQEAYNSALVKRVSEKYKREELQAIRVKAKGVEYTLTADRSLVGPGNKKWVFDNQGNSWVNPETNERISASDSPELEAALQMNTQQIKEDVQRHKAEVIRGMLPQNLRDRTWTWHTKGGTTNGGEGLWVLDGQIAPQGYAPYNSKEVTSVSLEGLLKEYPDDTAKIYIPKGKNLAQRVDREIERRTAQRQELAEGVVALQKAEEFARPFIESREVQGAAKFEQLGGASFYHQRWGQKPEIPAQRPPPVSIPTDKPVKVDAPPPVRPPAEPPKPEFNPPVVTLDSSPLAPILSPGDFPQYERLVSHPKSTPPMAGPLDMPQEASINYPFAQETGDYGPGSATYNLQFARGELRKFLNGGIGEASVQVVDSNGNFNDTGRRQRFTFDRATGEMWVVDDSGKKVSTVTRKVYFPDYLEAFRKISSGEGGNISENTLRQMRKEAPVVLELAVAFVSKGNGDYDRVRGFLYTKGVTSGDFETRIRAAVQDMFRGGRLNDWAILKENPQLTKAYILKHAREHGKDYTTVNSYMKKILGYGISEQEWHGHSEADTRGQARTQGSSPREAHNIPAPRLGTIVTSVEGPGPGAEQSLIMREKASPPLPVLTQAPAPARVVQMPIAPVAGEPGSPEHSRTRARLYQEMGTGITPPVTASVSPDPSPSQPGRTSVWGSGNDNVVRSFDSATVIGRDVNGERLRRDQLKGQIAVGQAFIEKDRVRYRRIRVEGLDGQQYVFAVPVSNNNLNWEQARRVIPQDHFEWGDNPYGTYEQYMKPAGTPSLPAPIESADYMPRAGGISSGSGGSANQAIKESDRRWLEMGHDARVQEWVKQVGDPSLVSKAYERGIFLFQPRRFQNAPGAAREIIANRLKEEDDGRPIAVIIYPKSDSNGAFDNAGFLVAKFRQEGYRVMYYEVGSIEGLASSLEDAAKRRQITNYVIGGHGTQTSTDLGTDFILDSFSPKRQIRGTGAITNRKREDQISREISGARITSEAEKRLSGISRLFSKDAVGFLLSCSTGEGGKDAENIANFWSNITNTTVFAPTIPTNIKDIIFDKNHKLVYPVYFSDRTRVSITYQADPARLKR